MQSVRISRVLEWRPALHANARHTQRAAQPPEFTARPKAVRWNYLLERMDARRSDAG